ncbi:MAG: hypothetical protein IPG45_16000 [Deltaproteobacteria bacterium]|nr:hypothetical protein [Deltaproteobacteria bacterium]
MSRSITLGEGTWELACFGDRVENPRAPGVDFSWWSERRDQRGDCDVLQQRGLVLRTWSPPDHSDKILLPHFLVAKVEVSDPPKTDDLLASLGKRFGREAGGVRIEGRAFGALAVPGTDLLRDAFTAIAEVVVERAEAGALAVLQRRLASLVCDEILWSSGGMGPAPGGRGPHRRMLPRVCHLLGTTQLRDLAANLTPLVAAVQEDLVEVGYDLVRALLGQVLGENRLDRQAVIGEVLGVLGALQNSSFRGEVDPQLLLGQLARALGRRDADGGWAAGRVGLAAAAQCHAEGGCDPRGLAEFVSALIKQEAPIPPLRDPTDLPSELAFLLVTGQTKEATLQWWRSRDEVRVLTDASPTQDQCDALELLSATQVYVGCPNAKSFDERLQGQLDELGNVVSKEIQSRTSLTQVLDATKGRRRDLLELRLGTYPSAEEFERLTNVIQSRFQLRTQVPERIASEALRLLRPEAGDTQPQKRRRFLELTLSILEAEAERIEPTDPRNQVDVSPLTAVKRAADFGRALHRGDSTSCLAAMIQLVAAVADRSPNLTKVSQALTRLTTWINAILTYASSYRDGQADPAEARAARKAALAGLIDGISSRRDRAGDLVVSFGVPVGVRVGVTCELARDLCHARGPQLSLPLGIAVQRLSPELHGQQTYGFDGFHLMATVVDVAQYLAYSGQMKVTDPAVPTASLALGLQAGWLLWIDDPSNAFVLGADVRFSPGLFPQTSQGAEPGNTQGAWIFSLGLAWYVPLFDLN